MVGRIDGDVAVRSRDVWLDDCDAVIVRGIPRGSLEQVIFRVDALHALEARGVTCVNGPRALERTIDKFLASALLARAGVSTPRTVACERADDALEAFEELGGDVIVKPLFGAMGAGMTRVDDADVAYRVFHALELERAVYYLQETLPHDGRDLRALVVGGRVLAAIERVGSGWRANLARGARAQATQLSPEQERLCLEAAEVLGVDYAGVDVLRAADGRDYVLELNGIPGWRGLQETTGADVAAALVAHAGGARQRSCASSRGPMTPRCSAVATSAPAAPAASSARRSSTLRTPPPASSSRSREGAVELGDQRDVRARAAAHPRQVEHDRLAQAGAVQAREGVERGQARELRVGRQHAAVAQVDAQDQGAVGQLREQAVERVGTGQRLGPDDDAVRAEVQQRLRPRGLADAGVDHDARLARQGADRSRLFSPSPTMASRSATYSSSSPSSSRNPRARASASPSSPPMTLLTGR